MLVPLVLVAVLVAVIIKNAWVCDDAYVTFRVIDNFINGSGLRWNIADRVQAYSNPLWLMLMTPVYYFSGEFYFSSITVSVILTLSAVMTAIWKSEKKLLAISTGILFLVCSNSFIDYSTSGLETAAGYFLFAVFINLYSGGELNKKRFFLIFLTAGFIILNRVDHGIIVFPFLLDCFIKYNRSVHGKYLSAESVISASAGLFPIIFWTVFSIIYYGFTVPNTAFAKLNIGIDRYLIIKQGFYYLTDFIKNDFIGASAVGILLISSFPLFRNFKKWPYFLSTVLYISYILLIGGDFMSGRFFTILIFMAFTVIISIDFKYPYVFAVIIPVVVAFSFLNPRNPLVSGRDYSNKKFNNGIADERGYYFAYTGLFNNSKETGKPVNPFEKKGIREGKFIIKDGIGFSGYNFGSEYHILDRYALGEPLLARIPYQNPFEIKKDFRPGHNGRDFPAGLKDSLKTGENRIVHPALKLYYDKLRIITKDDIFSWKRFYEILKMNTGQYDYLINKYNSIKMYSAYEMDTNYSKKESLISDAESESGSVRFSGNESDNKGFLVFGPYIKMKSGSYRVEFRIKYDNSNQNKEVFRIDVFSRNRSLTVRTIKHSDFKNTSGYKTFSLRLELKKDTEKIEFRVKALNMSKISVDTIKVMQDNKYEKHKYLKENEKKQSLISFEFMKKDFIADGKTYTDYPGINCEWDGLYDKEQYIFDWNSPDGDVAYSLHLREPGRSGAVWYPYKGSYPLKKGQWTVRARKIPYMTSLSDFDAGEKSFTE